MNCIKIKGILFLVFLSTQTSIWSQNELDNTCIVLRNNEEIIPVKDLDKVKVALISTHENLKKEKYFLDMLGKYTRVYSFFFNTELGMDKEKRLREKLMHFDILIYNIYSTDSVSIAMHNFVQKLNKKTIITNFQNNENLNKFTDIEL